MNSLQRQRRRIIAWLVASVVLMFGFSFALVPLYNTFCTITGLNGKEGGRMKAVTNTTVDMSRTITVEFVSHISHDMPWDFYPMAKKVTVHPGEMKRIVFVAKNHTNKTVVGQAIPSVAPGLAAAYLQKTECFCFSAQTLKPYEEREMPLIFYIDPALDKDIPRLTLSYTLYNVSPNNEEKKPSSAENEYDGSYKK